MKDIKLRFFDTLKATMFTSDDMNSYEVWDCVQDERFKTMLFTDLQDKNSVDIYGGDICYVEGHGNCLVFICPLYGVSFDDYNGSEIPLVDCIAEQNLYRVIGNIHENPELIELL